MSPLVTLAGPTMGTRFTVRAPVPEARSAAITARLQAVVNRVDQQMSSWKSYSVLSMFNASAPGQWFDIPPEMARVIAIGQEVVETSAGAFDMTLGRLVDLWGFGPSGPVSAPPAALDIAEALALSGWRRLAVREDGKAIAKSASVRLDLSGIAKGFGVDELARVLLAEGIEDFLAEIDGEMRLSGCRPDGQPWRVAVALPVPGLMAAYAALSPGTTAVATSGDYRRFFVVDGHWFSHTIDPATGRPVEGGPASVTVLDASCARADALASAMMTMPVEQGAEWAAENGVAALFLGRAGNEITRHIVGDIGLIHQNDD